MAENKRPKIRRPIIVAAFSILVGIGLFIAAGIGLLAMGFCMGDCTQEMLIIILTFIFAVILILSAIWSMIKPSIQLLAILAGLHAIILLALVYLQEPFLSFILFIIAELILGFKIWRYYYPTAGNNILFRQDEE